eukprot:scaffold107436_cov45-Prasinocladus_malaysianus.AAC.4
MTNVNCPPSKLNQGENEYQRMLAASWRLLFRTKHYFSYPVVGCPDFVMVLVLVPFSTGTGTQTSDSYFNLFCMPREPISLAKSRRPVASSLVVQREVHLRAMQNGVILRKLCFRAGLAAGSAPARQATCSRGMLPPEVLLFGRPCWPPWQS